MRQIIIEQSSLKDWQFSAVFIESTGCKSYIYFNDPREIIKDIEKLKRNLTSRPSRASDAVPLCKCREPNEVCELHGGWPIKPPPA